MLLSRANETGKEDNTLAVCAVNPILASARAQGLREKRASGARAWTAAPRHETLPAASSYRMKNEKGETAHN